METMSEVDIDVPARIASMLSQTTTAWAPSPSGTVPSGAIGRIPEVCTMRAPARLSTAWA